MTRHTTAQNVRVIGDGAHTVVFGNGFGTGQQIWQHQVEALRDRHRLVLFDYPGTPDTELSAYRPERYSSLYGYADDVVDLLDELEIEDATFVGHSVSAMIGTIAAIAVPERIARLVLIAGSPRYIDEPGYRGGFSREEIDAVLGSVATEYHSWISGFSPAVVNNARTPQVTDDFAAFLRRMRPDIAHNMLRITFTSDMRPILPKVEQPVLVIQPSSDIAVPQDVGRYLAEHLPHATLREIDATGHLPHATAPEQVTPLIVEYLPA